TDEHKIFDQHVICLAGDGCLQEGVSAEASAFGAHFGLDNLILIYDSNAVTLDAMGRRLKARTPPRVSKLMASTFRKLTARTCSNFSMRSIPRRKTIMESRSLSSHTP